jgi:hypothetical protein
MGRCARQLAKPKLILFFNKRVAAAKGAAAQVAGAIENTAGKQRTTEQ